MLNLNNELRSALFQGIRPEDRKTMLGCIGYHVTSFPKGEIIAFEGETRATLIRVENARAAMGQLLSLVAKAMNPAKQGVEQPCFISEGVAIPEDAYIGAFAYIGKNVQLGKGVQI